MSRPNPLVLLILIVATAGIMAWLGAGRGALMISAHEGDVYHLLDILFRMEQGLAPHQDFVTPLGILAFAPIVWLMEQGFGVGQAVLYSQVLLAAGLALPVWYVAWSRLSRVTGYVFAVVLMITVLALTYGGTAPGLSISMHYNRWAWSIASLLIVVALVPGRGRGVIDGLVLGIGFSVLALLKATFFVALLPGVAVALLLRREVAAIVTALVIGVAAAGGATVVLGVEFWTSYVGDLFNVARSEVRPSPGVSFTGLISQAQMLAVMVVGLLTYFWVSRAGHRASAMALVLLVPGAFYVSFQNFGNDPKWLVPFAAVLMALRPSAESEFDGPGLRTAMWGTALAAAVIYLPVAWTMALSPVRHITQDVARYEPMLRGYANDLFIRVDRARTMTATVHLDVEGSVWEKYRAAAERPELTTLNGVEFAYCEVQAGTLAFFEEIAADLRADSSLAPEQIFSADLPTAFWLFGVGQPLQGGAPWYYGDLSGIENASHVLVPKCAYDARVRGIIVSELEAAEVPLDVVRDTELYVLFAINQR